MKDKLRLPNEKEPLVEQCLGLVKNMAKRYVRRYGIAWDLLDDLIQAGNEQLVTIAIGFKSTPAKFMCYAVKCIKGAFSRELKSQRLIRLPENQIREIRQLMKACEEERIDPSQHIPPEQKRHIARRLCWDIGKVDTVLVAKDETFRWDIVSENETREKRFDPETLYIRNYEKDRCNKAISNLPARDRQIIELRNGFTDGKEYSQAEIARRSNRARQTINEQERRIKKQLRQSLKDLGSA